MGEEPGACCVLPSACFGEPESVASAVDLADSRVPVAGHSMKLSREKKDSSPSPVYSDPEEFFEGARTKGAMSPSLSKSGALGFSGHCTKDCNALMALRASPKTCSTLARLLFWSPSSASLFFTRSLMGRAVFLSFPSVATASSRPRLRLQRRLLRRATEWPRKSLPASPYIHRTRSMAAGAIPKQKAQAAGETAGEAAGQLALPLPPKGGGTGQRAPLRAA
mmetsp:Transcript_61719/g.198901  ORF Transcript_61719/g.198901 Transcript_61719/m.198901 type:complete len:222 (+) Transcript_61719:1273-1938(+)